MGKRWDGWVNTVLGLGQVATDKRLSGYHAEGATPSDREYETIFYEDGLAARIVEAVPLAALRQGFGLVTSSELDPDTKAQAESLIWDRWGDLAAADALYRAASWGRLFGGGGVLIGTEESDLEEPLDIEKPHQLVFLRAYDKTGLIPMTKYTDHLTAEYGEIERYDIQPQDGIGTRFSCHASRLLMFGGVLTSRRERSRLGYWDHSVLRRVYGDLRDYNIAWASVKNMLTDASMGILSIEKLWSILAGKLRTQFQERLDVINLAKWSANIMPLDTEEDFRYIERTFTGIPDTMDRLMMRISSITGVPVTVLFGRSAAGLNATGENDTRQWYDIVQSARDKVFQEPIETVIRMIAMEQNIPDPDSWGIVWPSLWQETPKEFAERMKLTADVDAAYIDRQVVTAEEVGQARYGTGEWSDAAPQIDREGRSMIE